MKTGGQSLVFTQTPASVAIAAGFVAVIVGLAWLA